MSSFSTGARSSLTATPAACPTAVPSGTGRSGMSVASSAPHTERTGPQKNSPRSTRWLPMSASTPDPRPPWYRQLIGASGVEPVVAPVVAVEVPDRPQHPVHDLFPDRVDGRRPAEREADRGHPVGPGRRAPPWPRRRPRSAPAASRTARACPRRAAPRRSPGAAGSPPPRSPRRYPERRRSPARRSRPARTRTAAPCRSRTAHGVGHRHQPHWRQIRPEHPRRRAVPVRMRPPGHARPDHRHPNTRSAHSSSSAIDSSSHPVPTPTRQPVKFLKRFKPDPTARAVIRPGRAQLH